LKKIAPEIEALMWTLAETGNQQAVEEFEVRFPHLRLELAKRSVMVRSLRQNRPDPGPSPTIPHFTPAPPQRPAPAKAHYALTCAFAAIAASALGYTLYSDSRPKPVVLTPVPAVNLGPVQTPQPVVSNSLPNPPRPVSPTVPDSPPKTSRDVPGTSPPMRDALEPKWNKAQTVSMRKVPLLMIARLVAKEGGLSLEIAPNMPDPSIDVDYRQVSAADILKDLGRTYSFTPMLSDDGSVILIPAVAQANTGGAVPEQPEHQ
jgi:hypothetical protein